MSASAKSRERIRITRTPDARVTGEFRPCGYKWVMAQSYTSLDANDLVRAEEKGDVVLLLRSRDNGESWQEAEVIDRHEPCAQGKVRVPLVSTFFLDPDNGLLVRFVTDRIDMDTSEHVLLWGDAVGMGPHTRRLFYQVSRDRGHQWEPRQQIIESGATYDAEHWGRDVWYGKSSLSIEGRQVHKLPDGALVIPAYLWPTEEYITNVFQEEGRPEELRDDSRYFVEPMCLLGRWRKDLSELDWEVGGPIRLQGGYTNAGTCGSDEPTIAFLDDGRWLTVLRTSTSHVEEFRKRNIPMYRYCAVSSDRGRTWRDGRPLTFDDGSPVFSPSAYSDFIRSSKNGKWYWIGNILEKPTYGNCDPRHPLQIAELDPESLSLKRETVTAIEDKKPDDLQLVRFSNFRVYEERGTKDFILLMTKCYCEFQEGFPNLPYPSYRYRIHIPDNTKKGE